MKYFLVNTVLFAIEIHFIKPLVTMGNDILVKSSKYIVFWNISCFLFLLSEEKWTVCRKSGESAWRVIDAGCGGGSGGV